ncbi:MAG TPA: RodZ domain-containing protein [Cellvibrio sp.]|nr:RodZ domain-containing protein [Cellvibrio sp.]
MVADDDKKPVDDGRFRELSPGKLLVWARERAGLNQEQVARELHMTLTKVRALESDDYRHMGSDTFTRGYLRSYANLVKLDVVQVLAAYDRHAQKHGLVEQVLPRRVESNNKSLWQFVVWVLLALLILWLISIWFFDNRQQSVYDRPAPVVPPVVTSLNVPSPIERVESAAASSVAQLSSPSVEAKATASVAASQQSLSAQARSSVTVNGQLSESKSSAASLSATNVSGVQVDTNRLDLISFSFTQECWLEVSDASGDVLIADLRSANSKLELRGKAPFDVTLGNSLAAQIELNGSRIALVPASGTKVLMIKVGQSIHE